MDRIEYAIYELLAEGIPNRIWVKGEGWKPDYEVWHEELVKIISEKLKVSEREVYEALDRLESRGSIVWFNGYYMLRQYSEGLNEQLRKLLEGFR